MAKSGQDFFSQKLKEYENFRDDVQVRVSVLLGLPCKFVSYTNTQCTLELAEVKDEAISMAAAHYLNQKVMAISQNINQIVLHDTPQNILKELSALKAFNKKVNDEVPAIIKKIQGR